MVSERDKPGNRRSTSQVDKSSGFQKIKQKEMDDKGIPLMVDTDDEEQRNKSPDFLAERRISWSNPTAEHPEPISCDTRSTMVVDETLSYQYEQSTVQSRLTPLPYNLLANNEAQQFPADRSYRTEYRGDSSSLSDPIF